MSFENAQVVVMGLGRFGGGVGVTRFLVSRGAHVLVTDQLDEQALEGSIQRLADLPADQLSWRLGEHVESDFAEADLVVVNPAVKPAGNPFITAARDAGVELTSEIRLLVEHMPTRERIIGITGTAGKSTVTAMVGHVLDKRFEAATQRVWVGGNIGGSLLGEIDAVASDDWVVLELSSFMLESLREAKWSPAIAAVTNLEPNHLDWHETFEAYAEAKRAILSHQSADDIAIIGASCAAHFEADCVGHKIIVDDRGDASPRPALLTPGRHNRSNARLAAAIVEAAIGPSIDETFAALGDFAGLPHRLQLVGEHQGVRYFNDSKCTTPAAAMLAIDALADEEATCGIHIILGGYDKGAALDELAGYAASRCAAIYTIGQTGNAIADAASEDAAGSDNGEHRAEVVRCETVDAAVMATATRVRGGDVVLLSPGCASWDQFDHFEKRGAAFVEAVLKYTSEGVGPNAVG